MVLLIGAEVGLFVLLGYGGFKDCFLARPSDISTREPRGDSPTPDRIG